MSFVPQKVYKRTTVCPPTWFSRRAYFQYSGANLGEECVKMRESNRIRSVDDRPGKQSSHRRDPP
jgi:hypothetical protein